METTRRPISFWIITVFVIVSMILLLMGQTMAIFNYEFAVKLEVSGSEVWGSGLAS